MNTSIEFAPADLNDSILPSQYNVASSVAARWRANDQWRSLGSLRDSQWASEQAYEHPD